MNLSIGNKIKKIRDQRNMSQKRFARKLGISEKTISAYETGRINPPFKVLEKISYEYDVTITAVTKGKKKSIEKTLATLEDCILEIRKLLH